MSRNTYTFEGKEVEEVWESFGGSYWVITEYRNGEPYGFAYLRAHPQSAGWGVINKDIVKEQKVWRVPQQNWTITGPEEIDIQAQE
jgi:hypothetical protein